MELEKDTQKEWEELGIETDWYARAVLRGWILPSCPWLNAAERMVNIVGRPAAELTKLFANQLDLYSLSPQEAAHKKFEEEVEKGTREERVKLNLAMAAYTGSPVSPINPEVYKWASEVIATVKRYRDESFKVYQEMASIPRIRKYGEVIVMQDWSYGTLYEEYRLYIPYTQRWLDVGYKKRIAHGHLAFLQRQAREARIVWPEWYV